jgi:CRISP-associated protein Cas1
MPYAFDLNALRPFALDMIARDPLPGADGVRAADVKRDLDQWLKPVVECLAQDEYTPQPYLRFSMQVDSKKRPIDCPALIDRVLMASVNATLVAKLKPSRSVYGVAGRGWQRAIGDLEETLQSGERIYALSFDFKDFYPSIQHDRLTLALEQRLAPKVVKLCQSWLCTPSIEGDRIIPSRDGLGIPQGASISSHLAQLYLEPFDRFIKKTFSDCSYYRYLDDCLLLSNKHQRLANIKFKLVQHLSRYGLKLNSQKVDIGKITKGELSYLNHVFPQGHAHHQNNHKAKITFMGSAKARLSTELARHALKKLTLDDTLWEKGESEGISIGELLSIESERAGRTMKWYQNARLKRPLRTLYVVNTPAKARINRGALVIEPYRGERREFPLSHVGQIVAMGPLEMTSATMRYCLNEDVPVLFLSSTGSYFGRLDSAKRQREPLLERQFMLRTHPDRQLAIAKSIVQGRLHNARILLSRNNRKAKRRHPLTQQVINLLKQSKSDLRYARSLDQVRGIEGRATKAYWSGYAQLLPPSAQHRDESPERPYHSKTWGFKGRNRRPPLDPVNSLISFLAVLLTYNIYSIIELCGLTPYVGVLHSSQRRAPALAFDLIEEFRAPLVEGVALSLVGKRILSLSDFEWRDTPKGEGIFIRKSALPKALKAFEAAMSAEREHPHFGLRGDMRRMIHLQVLHFAACIDRDDPYKPFILR